MSKQSRLELLEAYLSTTILAGPIVNDGGLRSVDDIEQLMAEIGDKLGAIKAKAEADKRELSDDEKDAIDHLAAQFENLEDELDRTVKLDAVNARLATARGRKTDPNDVAAAGAVEPPAPAGRPRPGRVPAAPRDAAASQRWGFDNFGGYALAVRNASRGSPHPETDVRLIQNAPATFGREGIGEDGGFLVPPEWRTEIMQMVEAEASLLALTDQYNASRNQVVMPIDETTPWQTTGGIQASWEGEGGQLAESKPAFREGNFRLNKLTCLVTVTEELLEDAPLLAGYLRNKAGAKMGFKINDAIIAGTGAGMPRGILNSPALVTVDKESGQVADTVLARNISNMWARMYAPCRFRAVWLINQDIEPQLDFLSFVGTDDTGAPSASVSAVPLYMPPGGLSERPYGTIKGRPVMPMESCKTLGDRGDIILADLSKYMTIQKVGGLRSDVSMHLYFDWDMQAFRFILRLAGDGWWTQALTPKNGSMTRSCFVTLAAR